MQYSILNVKLHYNTNLDYISNIAISLLFNNRNSTICSKLTLKTPERRQWLWTTLNIFHIMYFCCWLGIPAWNIEWYQSFSMQILCFRETRQVSKVSVLLSIFLDKFESLHIRSSRPEVFCKKGVVENFAKFTGKHLRQSLFFNKVAGLSPTTLLEKRLWHSYFPVNFAKLLRKPLVATFCDQWNFQPLLFVFLACFGFSFSCTDFDLKQKRLGFFAPRVSGSLNLFQMWKLS